MDVDSFAAGMAIGASTILVCLAILHVLYPRQGR
jgi:hypothetical protein